MRNILACLILFSGISFLASAQIPKHPNKLDATGKRQGQWVYLYDTSWNAIDNRDSAKYYRVATYKDDKPVGVTRDFYSSGQVQMAVKLLRDNPDEYDSLLVGYDIDGFIINYFYYDSNEFKLDKTLEHYNTLVQSYKKNSTTDPSSYARALDTYGDFLFSIGEMDQAESVYMEALAIHKKVNTNDLLYLSLIDNLARVETELDHMVKAEVFMKESLSAIASMAGKNSIRYANALSYMSIMYHKIGDYEKSRETTRETIRIYEKNNVNSGNYYAILLSNLSAVHANLGNMKEAEEIGDRAIQMLEKSTSRSDINTIRAIRNQARLYTFTGQYARAEKLLLESVELDSKNGLDPNRPDEINVTNYLAQLYAAMGQNKNAESYYKKDYSTSRRRRPHFVEAHANFAFDQKLLTQADTLYSKAISIRLQQIQENFPVMSERQREVYFTSNLANFLDNYNSFAVSSSSKRPSVTGDMYDLQLATKAILLNSSAKWKQRIKTSGDVKLFSLYQEWEKMAKQLAKAESGDETSESIADLRTKTEELEKTLTKRSDLFSKLVDKKKYTWRDVASKLKPGEAAIEIIRFRKRGIPTFVIDSSGVKLKRYPKYDLTDTIHYAALIVKPGSKNPKLVLLKHGNDLEGKYLKFYQNNVRSQVEDIISYNHFWGDIAKELTGIKKVHLSSDGVYHRINLNSLMNPKTKKYVLDEIEITLVTNTKDMLLPPSESSENHYALLIGMPEFGSKNDFSNLPGTKEEIENVSTMLQAQGWQADIFLQADAKEENIKDAFKPAVLHIATHGYFKEEPNENPLLQSGLVLAGAGLKTETSVSNVLEDKLVEDGILTAYEAMNLNLDNTEIVVLSACETGLGEIKTGEGVYGLQRAFTVAGAKSIVMSLWKVNDETTREVMTIFYQKWMSGISKRDAFREAQLELRKKYPAPYFWSAFVMLARD